MRPGEMDKGFMEDLRRSLRELTEVIRELIELLKGGGGGPLMGTKEAARMLGCSDERIRGMIASGELKGVRDGRCWRVPRVQVERILSEKSS